ncbi:subtilisin-like protein [Coprinopsis marcescibilis]|uniref:Subtilisin-like protein n=1 Tax=Coprinopsis marcescibilis TaxID=230819 RepID=A0A5C3KUN3_COPMA|nr:subtilisin-like protein [Coprinopsis marcescibilis]
MALQARTITEAGLAALRGSQDVLSIALDSYTPPPASGLRCSSPLAQSNKETIIRYMESKPEDTVSAAALVTQNNANWGVARLQGKLKDRVDNVDNAYTYNDTAAGTGVDIYAITNGIWEANNDLHGRVRFGVNTYRDETIKKGIVLKGRSVPAGTRWGVAKKANIIKVIVFEDDPWGNRAGTAAHMISGFDWISKEVQASKRPSVVQIPWVRGEGYRPSIPLDNAADALTEQGIHVVVAAGDDNEDLSCSCKSSPGRSPSVITVGATDINDGRSTFSNYGPLIDFFAPGQDVTVAGPRPYNGVPNATSLQSSTSISSGIVAGMVAHLISRDGNISPAAMKAKLSDYSIKDIVTHLPEGYGTTKSLVQLGPV